MKKYAKYTDEEKEFFCKLAQESWRSCAEVAHENNIIPNTLMYWLKKRGIFVPYKSQGNKKINPYKFDVIDTELSAYWIGFIYADGNVSGSMFTISANRIDRSHIEKLNSFLESEYIVKDYPRRRGGKIFDQSMLHISNKYLASSLVQKGIVAHRPNFQDLASQIPNSLQNHLIRGMFDGDGCASSQSQPRLIFCGQYEQLSWIRSVLQINAGTRYDQKISPHISGSIYYLTYYGNHIFSVADWMYKDATLYLDRKFAKIKSYSPRKHKNWKYKP